VLALPRPRMAGGRWVGPEGVEPSSGGRAHDEEDRWMEEDVTRGSSQAEEEESS
jgi:hypothetical protein